MYSLLQGQPLTGLFWYDPEIATNEAPFFQHIHYQAWIDTGPGSDQDYYVYADTSQYPDVNPLGFLDAASAQAGTRTLSAVFSAGCLVAFALAARATHHRFLRSSSEFGALL